MTLLFSNMSLEALKRVRSALDKAIEGAHEVDGVDILVDDGRQHVRAAPAAAARPVPTASAAAGTGTSNAAASTREERTREAQCENVGLFQ